MSDRYVKLPVSVVNDERLSAEAVVAYAIMLDASRDGKCIIGFERLGKRLHRSRDTGRRIVRELIDAGYVRSLPIKNGQRPRYELQKVAPATVPSTYTERQRLGGYRSRRATANDRGAEYFEKAMREKQRRQGILTGGIDATGQEASTCGTDATGPSDKTRGTDATGTGSVDATGTRSTDATDPLHPCNETRSTHATHSRLNSRLIILGPESKNENAADEPSKDLVDLIRRCGFNGDAESKAIWATHQTAGPLGADRYLLGWLRFALNQDGIEDRLDFAVRKTQRMERVPD
jgi:hypothetical protein